MHPISELLCKAYEKLYKWEQVKFPLREGQREALNVIVKTVNSHYFGFERYPTAQDKAVAYLCYIIKDHPVTDGNKRLSILWFEAYCELLDLKYNASPYTLDVIAVAIEKTESRKMDELMGLVKVLLFGRR